MNGQTSFRSEAASKGGRKEQAVVAAASCSYTPPVVPGFCIENRRFTSRFSLSACAVGKVEKLCNMLPVAIHWPVLWATVFLVAYFFLMDCRLYQVLQSWTAGTTAVNATIKQYSPFHPLTFKLLMINHGNHYVLMPLAEYFDEYTLFSKRFPFITANMVSFSHIVVCLIAFRMLYSDNLTIRRWGCILFQLRNWLDALDGVVHRSHAGTAHRLKSYRHTTGHYVDIVADTSSGFLASFSMYLYLWKNPPTVPGSHVLPWTNKENSRTRKEYTKWEIFRPCLISGLLLGFSGIFWDRYINKFNQVMEFSPKTTLQQEQQLYQLKTFRMWIFIWLWKALNAQSLMDYGLIAIAMDKTWSFIHIMQYIVWPAMIIICLATEIQLADVMDSVIGSS